jgi:dolichyl-diphosphooligosaccharide--protein glycosyltransferase
MAEESKKQRAKTRDAAKKQSPSPAPWDNLLNNMAVHGRYITIIALIVIYGIGFFIRFEDYPKWRENSDMFFFNGAPLLVNGDGYYYLRLARDLSEGQYDSIDSRRWYPDTLPRPSPPPLLSITTNLLHKIFRTSLDWIAVLLPVLLAPLLLLPVYGLARVAGGGRIMALTAALMCVMSEYYVGRTRIGWFDTDCLIVTLTAGICYFCWRFAREMSLKRYLYAAAAVAGFGIFLLWWDTAPGAVSAICIMMFFVTLSFFYRPARREGYIFAGVVAGVTFLFLLWRGFDAPIAIIRTILGRLIFVTGGEAGPFPSTISNVRELQVLGFAQMAKLTSGHIIFFIAAVAGFTWLLVHLRKRALLFAVIALLAIMPFRLGNRFLIFQVPVVALGLGFMVERLWHLRIKWKFIAIAALLVALLPPVVCFSYCVPKFYRSHITRSMNAIQAVIDESPGDAILWTTWWHGYPIQYYTRRAVITDGGALQGQRLVFQNLPLACSNARMAANFMQFWIGRGSEGMERLYAATNGDHAVALRFLKIVCSAGPEEARKIIEETLSGGKQESSVDQQVLDGWVRFFFPEDVPPIYLLLTQDLTESMEWFRRGSWDPAKREGKDAFYRRYYGIRLVEGELRNNEGLSVDVEKGTALLHEEDGSRQLYPLAHLVTFTGKNIDRTKFNNEGVMRFEWIQPVGYGAAMNRVIAESMFNNLYIRHRIFPRYFRQAALMSPYYQLWEVKGESIVQTNEINERR